MVLKFGAQMPEILAQQDSWLDAKPNLHNDGAVLVHFWAMSCPACHANMPHLQDLRAGYAGKGLSVVAVHMPRMESDLDISQVRHVAAELNILEPCALDNEHRVGDEFGVNAWPAYYLFDADKKLRRRAVSNFGVNMIQQALLQSLGDPETETT